MGNRIRPRRHIRSRRLLRLETLTRLSSSQGLSLAELLIAILISGMIALAASSIVLDNIQITSRQDSILRLQEDWNRIQFLIDQDMAEGSGACMSGDTLTIYKEESRTFTPYITYSLTSEGLEREGPTITDMGALDEDNPSTDIVANNVSEFAEGPGNGPCSATAPSQRTSYRLSLREIRQGKVIAQYTNQGRGSSGYSRVDPIDQ